MRKITKSILLLTSAVCLSSSQLSAVETDPVGYKTVTIKGNNSLNLVGIEFLEAPAFSGPVSSVGTNTLTVTGQNFDQVLDSGGSYFLDVVSGDNEGINTGITSWSGDTLTLRDDLSSLVFSAVDSVRVHRLPTIGEIFGVGGDVLGGGSAVSADIIYLPNPENTGLLKVYYSTGGFAGHGWRIIGEGFADQSDFPLYFPDGMFILKKSAGDSSLVLSGSVKVSGSSTVIEEGFTPLNTMFPSGATLGNSGLYDPSNPSRSLSAGSAVTADRVYMDSDGDGSLEIYFYSSGGFAGEGWRRIGAGSSDMSELDLTSGIGVLRRSTALVVDRTPAY